LDPSEADNPKVVGSNPAPLPTYQGVTVFAVAPIFLSGLYQDNSRSDYHIPFLLPKNGDHGQKDKSSLIAHVMWNDPSWFMSRLPRFLRSENEKGCL
jgi:hypothetical protein